MYKLIFIILNIIFIYAYAIYRKVENCTLNMEYKIKNISYLY